MKNNEILHIPSLEVFGDWETLQKFLERRGNPLYSIGGGLDSEGCKNLTSLGNLTSVRGSLFLTKSNIKSLGNLTSVGGYLGLYGTNIKSLGNLTSVGGKLDLVHCFYLTSLGNLTSVGGDLYLRNTPISRKYSENEIRKMVDVKGEIYL
jgi:hypothetical protein